MSAIINAPFDKPKACFYKRKVCFYKSKAVFLERVQIHIYGHDLLLSICCCAHLRMDNVNGSIK